MGACALCADSLSQGRSRGPLASAVCWPRRRRCGDNHVGGDEQCDGTDVGGITCTDLTGASCRRDGGRSPARPIAPCKARTSDNSGRVRAVAPLVLMCNP